MDIAAGRIVLAGLAEKPGIEAPAYHAAVDGAITAQTSRNCMRFGRDGAGFQSRSRL